MGWGEWGVGRRQGYLGVMPGPKSPPSSRRPAPPAKGADYWAERWERAAAALAEARRLWRAEVRDEEGRARMDRAAQRFVAASSARWPSRAWRSR